MKLVHGSQAPVPLAERAQVVVVGSGPGGANVALRLKELGVDVLMVELGGVFDTRDFSAESLAAMAMLWREFGQRATRGDAIFPVPGGQGLGGGTLINAGICFRVPGFIRDEWHDRFGAEWATAERLDPIFDWVWETMAVAPVAPHTMGVHNGVSREAMAAAGWSTGVIDRNAPGCVGCGVCFFGCPSGGKYSSDKAQLAQAMSLGMGVITRARVEEVITEGGIARGVVGTLLAEDGFTERGPFRVDADAVVLSAGAVDTAILLQNSGLGGVEDGIGANLSVHPAAAMMGYYPDRRIDNWNGVPQAVFSDEFAAEGWLVEASNIPAAAFYGLGARAGEDPLEWMGRFPHIAAMGGMTRDGGNGEVSAGIGGKADVVYRVTDAELARFNRSMYKCAEAYFAGGAAGVIPAVSGAGVQHSLAELDATLKRVDRADRLNLYGSHPQGTVAFAADPKDGPLHPHFHLHGTDNLFVADSSVFPRAIGVNPQITIMALGRLAGEYVAEAVA